MASRAERHRILTGGLSTVPPGDKSGEGNSLVMENWRVDKDGILSTRGAVFKEPNAPVGSGNYHTIARNNNYRYSGIGTELYFGPEPVGAPLLGTGFDGSKLGIAFYQGYAWVMNRLKQLRIEFQSPFKWGVDTPTGIFTAAAGGQPSVEIETYDGTTGQNDVTASQDGITWDVAMTADIPGSSAVVAATFDSSLKIEGAASLKLVAPQSCTISAKVALGGFDTRVEGTAPADDDQFALALWASNPQAIQSMAIRLTNLDGAGNESKWVEVSFSPGTSIDPVNVLSQSPQSWTNLSIRRTLNVSALQASVAAASSAAQDGTGDYQTVTDLQGQLSQYLRLPTLQVLYGGDPQVLGINPATVKPVQDFDWSSVANMYVSFVLSDACEIHLDDAKVIGSQAAALSGSITYFVSFFNQIFEDGNPLQADNDVVVANEHVTLSNIPISASSEIRGRYIYRIGGGLNQALRVGTIFDNTTTSWTDPTSNEQAQDDGFQMPINRTLPPPARGVIGPFFGKLIAFSTEANPSRYFWTPAGQPWFFPGSDDEDIGNWEDLGDEDEILNIQDHKTMLVFYKRRSIWRLVGDPQTNDPVRCNSNIGVVGASAVASGGAFDYFVGPEGVYRFNGDSETKISQMIDSIFKNDYPLIVDDEAIMPMNRDAMDQCVLALRGDRLRLSYAEFGFSKPNRVLIYHTETGRWGTEKYTGLSDPAFTAMYDEGSGRHLMGGLPGGYLYNMDAQDSGVGADDGNPFRAIWQSRFDDQGLPDNNKVYSDLEIEFQTGSGPLFNFAPSTLDVYLIFDNLTKVLIGNISSDVRTTRILKIRAPAGGPGYAPDGTSGRFAKNVAVRIEGDINAVAHIYGTWIHWYPQERLALSFDVGFTDLGIPERAKQCDYIEIYLTAQGQMLKRTFWSDLPGSLLVIREVATFRAPNGRGNVRFRLPSTIEGRNFRLTIEGVC